MERRRWELPPAEEEHPLNDTSAERIYKLINKCYDIRVKEDGEIVIVWNRRRT